MPDRHGTGTNALVLHPPRAIDPSFGPGSRERHAQLAEEAGASLRVEPVPSLVLDVDTPDDLEALRRALEGSLGNAAHTRGLLRRLARNSDPRSDVITAAALPGIPTVAPGDDLGELLARAAPADLGDGDVLVVAQKVVSKAEGRVVRLAEVVVSDRAARLAAEIEKDPRLVEVILGESAGVVRSRRGVLIVRTHHGFVCANAGVDASNAPGEDAVVLLPVDPDGSARALRARLLALRGVAPAVVIADSFGRAWRRGQADVALGAPGWWRSTTGPAGWTPRAASCARRRSRWRTRRRPRPTWRGRRTPASPPSSSAGSSAS